MKPGASVEIPLPDVPPVQRTWKLRPQRDCDALVSDLAVPPLVGQLLANRGIDDADVGRLWLGGSIRDLPDPRAMHGMAGAVDRLLAAIDDHERICIHGDYDVDGCTSVALLVHLLRRFDADVVWYAPHRQRDGYGVALHTVQRLADEGVRVLVTCDTGVSAHEAIDLGNSLGVDTVVCDHHTLPAELPAACAIVNPKIDGVDSPYWELAAVGVSFMLAVALRAALRDRGAFRASREPDLREYLDIVALGTVADLAPLRGINRLLVQTGLKVLSARRRPGLRALMEVAGISQEMPAESSHLGFRLGPRINAAGRLGEASRAVDLLLSERDAAAREIATELDEMNGRRQQTERRIFSEALAQVKADPDQGSRRGLVLWDADWHPGVVGIVASRLVQHLHRPTLVLAARPDGTAVGSGRAFKGLDLYATLERYAPLLERFGGHRAAAGLTIRTENLPALREAFAHEAFAASEPGLWEPTLSVDAELDLDCATWPMHEAMAALGPFGIGNPEPLFMTRSVRATEVRALSKGGLRMVVRQGDGPRIGAIGFGLGLAPEQVRGDIDLAYHLQVNTWRGTSSLELRLRGVQPT